MPGALAGTRSHGHHQALITSAPQVRLLQPHTLGTSALGNDRPGTSGLLSKAGDGGKRPLSA